MVYAFQCFVLPLCKNFHHSASSLSNDCFSSFCKSNEKDTVQNFLSRASFSCCLRKCPLFDIQANFSAQRKSHYYSTSHIYHSDNKFCCFDKSILYMPILFALGLVYVNIYARVIKFWLRLTCMKWMTEDTPGKLCYCIFKDRTMQHGLPKIRCLCTFGFGVVWEMQGVGNINVSIREFQMKFVDSFKTDLLHGSHDLYHINSNFHQSLSKRAFARFRIRMH